MPHSGDMEMWLRFAAHASVGLVDAYQAVYRRHSTNMSRGYARSNSLSDLQQRKSALDCFFRHQNIAAWDAPALQRRMSYSLSREAVELASGAFNNGEFAIHDRLLECANGVQL